MRLPQVNSFFWIGLALIAIGAFAIHRGAAFMFDPGVPSEPHEALYYLVVGVIMLVNGLVQSTPAPSDGSPGSSV